MSCAKKEEPEVYGAVNYDPYGKPRIGDWIQTRTGRKFHILDPRPTDFCIEDIAHSLANQCRFTGHTRCFYSIAEHSVRVARRIMVTHPNLRPWFSLSSGRWTGGALYGECWGSELAYHGLLHDATEAYLCDLARPFKQLPEFAFYRELEHKMMGQIAIAFGVEYPFHPAIKAADEVLLGTEARDLMWPCTDGWHFRHPHLKTKIRPWSARKAKHKFLALYHKLCHKPSRTKSLWHALLGLLP